jgi:hypothetical protein
MIYPTVSKMNKERWIENFARTGIFAKGIVYCLIGLLTSMAALGLSGKKMDKEEAFKLIYEQPFGKTLLICVAIGLLGYITWRLFQAIQDIDHEGKDSKAVFKRIGYGFSALIYLTMAIYAFKLALHGPSSGGGTEKSYITKLLDYPGGNWILGIAAVGIIIGGFRQIYKGYSQRFMKGVNFIRSEHAGQFKKAGIAGYISRGVVLVVIGYFFLRAGLHRNADEVKGTKGAFDFLENNFGSVLMGLVALGLFGYGVFMFVKGRYQKIDMHF